MANAKNPLDALFDREMSVNSLVTRTNAGWDNLQPNTYKTHQSILDNYGGKAAYADVKIGNTDYYYIPEDFINKGFKDNEGRQWAPIDLFKGDTLQDLASNADYVDLTDITNGSSIAEQYGMSKKGYLIPLGMGKISDELYYALRPSEFWDPEAAGNIQGLSKTASGQFVYRTDKPNGYIDPINSKYHWYQPAKKSPLAGLVGAALSIFAPGIGTAIGTALGASGAAASVLGAAVVNGTLSEISGGDFMDGAIKGAITAGVAPAVANTIGSNVAQAMGDSAFKNVVTNAVTGATNSAISATLSGGNLAEAALAGAVMGASNAAGREIGIAAEYGTQPFTEQTQMLLRQEAPLGGVSQTGAELGRAAGAVALGADPEKLATDYLLDKATGGIKSALTTAVNQAVQQIPDALTNVFKPEGEAAPDMSELTGILSGPKGVQVASADKEAGLGALLGQRDEDTEAGEGPDFAFKTSPDLFVGPLTEDRTKRVNEEFARYLDYLQAGEPLPPEYGVQDLGITPENWQSFNQNLTQMQEEGRLPTQWKSDTKGNYTFTSDDGSTLTIDSGGEIVNYTEAPMGNLPGEVPPAGTQKPGTQQTTQKPAVTPSPTSRPAAQSGMDVNALMSLLGAMGGTPAQAPAPQPFYSEMPEFDVTKAFSPTLARQREKLENPFLDGMI